MKTKSNKKTDIPRLVILQEIFENFGQIKQWVGLKTYNIVVKNEQEAKCLIELLEVFDCGSFGGFDDGQQEEDRNTLFNRFLWLLNKYNNEKDLDEKYCKFEDIKNYC